MKRRRQFAIFAALYSICFAVEIYTGEGGAFAIGGLSTVILVALFISAAEEQEASSKH